MRHCPGISTSEPSYEILNILAFHFTSYFMASVKSDSFRSVLKMNAVCTVNYVSAYSDHFQTEPEREVLPEYSFSLNISCACVRECMHGYQSDLTFE